MFNCMKNQILVLLHKTHTSFNCVKQLTRSTAMVHLVVQLLWYIGRSTAMVHWSFNCFDTLTRSTASIPNIYYCNTVYRLKPRSSNAILFTINCFGGLISLGIITGKLIDYNKFSKNKLKELLILTLTPFSNLLLFGIPVLYHNYQNIQLLFIIKLILFLFTNFFYYCS